MEVRKLILVLPLAVSLIAGCGSGGGGNPTPAPAGPGDLSKLSPEEQIKQVENDKSMPQQFKATAIKSIKDKYGLK
jgi:hypothetical protein